MTESDLEAVRPYMSVSGGFPRNPRAKVLGRHATTSFDAVADSGALMHAVRGQEAPVQHEAWAPTTRAQLEQLRALAGPKYKASVFLNPADVTCAASVVRAPPSNLSS